jgi:hypothetical protein
MARQTNLRLSLRLAALLGGAAISTVFSGCLHLGGGTTYVQEDKVVIDRVSTLERRMEVLESAIIRAASAELPAPVTSTAPFMSDKTAPVQPAPEFLPTYPGSN